jgi:hypothetical protein
MKVYIRKEKKLTNRIGAKQSLVLPQCTSPTYLPTNGGHHNSTITLVVGTGLGSSIINNIMGAITKARLLNPMGTASKDRFVVLLLQLKGLAKKSFGRNGWG